MKTCSKCSIDKPLTEYSKSKRGLHGLRSNCKSCDRARCRSWKDNNPDKVKKNNEAKTARQKQNPELTMYNRIKRRASLFGIDFNLDLKDIVIPAECPILKIKLEVSNSKAPNRNSPSLDRIDTKLGYIKGNVQVISYKANTMKQDANISELILFAKWVQEYVKGTHGIY